MARKNNDAVTLVPMDDYEDDDMGQPEKPTGTEALRRTANILETMSGTDQIGEGYIVIHAVEGQSESRCMKVPADKYAYDDLMDVVARDFGAGDYRIRLYLKATHGRFVLTENRLESIKAPKTDNPVVPFGNVPANAPTDVLLRELVERQQKQMDLMMERQQAQLAGMQRPDLLAMAERVAVVATPFIPVLTAMMSRRGSGSGNAIGDLKGLLELTGVVRDMREPGMPELPPDQPAWAGLLSQGLQMLPSILAAAKTGQPVQTLPALVGTPPATTANAVNPNPVPPLPEPTGEPDVSVFVAQLPALLQSAGSGLAPDEAARQLYAFIPPDSRASLADTVGHPLFIKAMIRETNGQILDVLDWVMYMREELLTLLDDGIAESHAPTGQDHVKVDTGREAGDTGHPSGNEAVNPGIQE